jgi:hypothetical protein
MRSFHVRVLALATCVATPALHAQDPRLAGRLDPATAAEVERLVDSARAAGLPTVPLVDKALEGATKGAADARILAAVRGLAQRLGAARDALGTGASDAELVAAAGALYQGVSTKALSQLRAARARSSLALPLVVLADLIARGVPSATATAAVLDLARSDAGDAAFMALRRDVENDIANGAPPAIAAATRARGSLYGLPPVPATPGAGAPVAGAGAPP